MALFRQRKQLIVAMEFSQDDGVSAILDIAYRAVLKADIPTEMKAGDTFNLKENLFSVFKIISFLTMQIAAKFLERHSRQIHKTIDKTL